MSFTDRFNVDQPAQISLQDDIEQPNVHCDWSRPNDPDPDREKGSVVNTDHATSDDEHRRYPKRATTKPRHLDDYVTTAVIDNADCEVDYCHRLVMGVPQTFADTVASTEASGWQSAMEREMTSLRDNDVFEVVALPEGRDVVKGRWVYTVKEGPNRSEQFKARYVANGFSKVEGVDYHETFAPTTKMASIRTMANVVAQHDMVVHQLDVKSAYLHAPIDCDLYLEPPQGSEKEMMIKLYGS